MFKECPVTVTQMLIDSGATRVNHFCPERSEIIELAGIGPVALLVARADKSPGPHYPVPGAVVPLLVKAIENEGYAVCSSLLRLHRQLTEAQGRAGQPVMTLDR